MYCSTCGAYVSDDSTFCSVCGAQLASVQSQNIITPETETLSNDYEETGRLDESSFTPLRENIIGQVPITDQQHMPFVQQTYQNYGNVSPQVLDEKEFYKQFASKNTNGWVIAIIVACFLTMATSIPSLVMGNLFSLIDIMVYLIFGVLIVLKKRWYFTLPVTVYSAIGTVLTIAIAGAATGIFALVAGIISTIKLKKINAAYEQYKKCGALPQNVI